MNGKRGIMSTSFERIEYKSSGNGCDEEERVSAKKYVYDIQGEPSVEDEVSWYKARPSAIYIAVWGNKFENEQLLCSETTLEDGVFYDVKYLLFYMGYV